MCYATLCCLRWPSLWVLKSHLFYFLLVCINRQNIAQIFQCTLADGKMIKVCIRLEQTGNKHYLWVLCPNNKCSDLPSTLKPRIRLLIQVEVGGWQGGGRLGFFIVILFFGSTKIVFLTFDFVWILPLVKSLWWLLVGGWCMSCGGQYWI